MSSDAIKISTKKIMVRTFPLLSSFSRRQWIVFKHKKTIKQRKERPFVKIGLAIAILEYGILSSCEAALQSSQIP